MLGLALVVPELDASAGQIHPECRSAGMRVLSFYEVPGFDTRDYCDESAVDPRIRPLLDQLAALNSRVAEILDVPLSSFEPLNVRFQTSPRGPLDSATIMFLMNIGVTPEWKGGQFDSSAYVHELGHILMNWSSHFPKVPSGVGALWYHPLFGEAIPDLLALSVTGNVIQPGVEVPTCLDQVRFITASQSYRAPISFFDDKHANRELVRCCASIRNGGVDASDYWRNYCDSAEVKRLEANLPAWDERELGPRTWGDGYAFANGMEMASHQIGAPWVSFLMDYSQTVGAPLGQALRSILRLATAPNWHYECFLKADPKLRVTTTLATLREIAARLRGGLSEAQRLIFDLAWDRHAMDLALELDDLYFQENALGQASRKVYEMLDKSSHPCRGQDLEGKCEVVCRRTH